MFDVRDHQFLMLLFMMQTKYKDGRNRCQLPLIDLLQQVEDVLIDIAAVPVSLLDGGPGDQTAIGSAVPFSQRVVVGIKQVRILWMKGLVSRNRWKEEKGLEKPADVGNMPLGRTHIWHGLNDIIFGYKRFAQVLSEAANFLVLLDEILLRRWPGDERTFFFERGHCRFSFCQYVQVNSLCKAIRSPTDVIKPMLFQRDDLLHLQKQRAVFHME
ncbi:MAG: hypothetical protein NVSMB27_04940 [Ktedonobacteraceae bacterium]